MPFGHGDGGGGPTREMLERARRLADLDGAPRVAIGTPAEFFEHVEREIHRGAPVPVWRGELYFETHRGTLTSQIRTKLGNRRCERLLREAELWAATSGVECRPRRALAGGAHAAVPRHPARIVDRLGPRRRRGGPRPRRQQLRDRIAVSLATLAPGTPTLANVASHDRDEIVVVDAVSTS